ncbi:MAG: hypothetical protein ACK5P7_13890 [Bdellovibrio sp.]
MNVKPFASSLISNLDRYQLVQANAHRLASRLDSFSPLLAKRYHEYINSFFNETNFVSGVELVDIPDSNGLIIPVDCKISQLVVMVSDGSYGNKRYIINEDLWNLLDDDNKAATLFHEVIYRLAIETGQNDSRWTRYFNAIVFSDQISRMTANQFSALRKQAYSSRFSYKGFVLAGSMNPDQKLYQVMSGPSSETFGTNLDDGIYNMENDFLLEAHFGDIPVPLNGLNFPKGLSMSFSQKGVLEQIYAPAISGNRNGLDLIPPDSNECRWQDNTDIFLDFCGIIKMKWDSIKNEFQILKTDLKHAKNKIQLAFDNNVQVILIAESSFQFSEGMNQKAILDQLCDVNSSICSEAYIKFLNGLLRSNYDNSQIEAVLLKKVKIETNGRNLVGYSSLDYGGTLLSYKIPASYSGDLLDVEKVFETKSVQFNPNGNYSFESYSRPRKLALKNGSTISLTGGDYNFSFDRDGFLLSALPK